MEIAELQIKIDKLRKEMDELHPKLRPKEHDKESSDLIFKFGDMKNEMLSLLSDFYNYHTSSKSLSLTQIKLMEGIRLMCRSPEITNTTLLTYLRLISSQFDNFKPIEIPKLEKVE